MGKNNIVKIPHTKKVNPFESMVKSRVEQKMKTLQKRKEQIPLNTNIIKRNSVKLTQRSSVPSFLRKRNKKKLFELNSDEDDFEMKHNGKAIDEMDGEELNEFTGHIDMSGAIDTKLISKLQFSGFDEDGGKKGGPRKSKKELFEEIIKKSRLFKLEKQKEHEENLELKNKLDANFDDIFSELTMIGDKRKKLKIQTEYDRLGRTLQYESRKPATVVINPEKAKLREKRRRRKHQDSDESSEDNDFKDYDKDEELDDKELKERKAKGSELTDKEERMVTNFNRTLGNLKSAAEADQNEDLEEDVLDDIDFDTGSEEDQLSESDLEK